MKRWLAPSAYARSISHIDLERLAHEGVRGAIVDLDNTLVGHYAHEPEAEVVAWIARAARAGVAVIVVTNNRTPWAAEVARALKVPIVPNARKPLRRGFRLAVKALALPREAVVVIGDQLFTDVLGAKFAGLRVILVDPIVRHDPWKTLPFRIVERWLLRDVTHTERGPFEP